jgi:hypothetical protein
MLGVYLVLELIALYFLSRWVTQAIFTFFLLIFRVRAIAVSFLLVLEFPGTVLHELSHLFTAEILGVRTGKMTLEPESIRGSNITTGSVMVASSDPFRRYMIGLAPLFWGMAVLTAISYFLPGILTSVTQTPTPWYENTNTYLLLSLGYLLFAVSNTMFSSPEDLKGFIPFALIIGLIVGALYMVGLRINLTGQVLDVVIQLVTTLLKSLGVVLAINIGLLILTKILTLFISKILHVRVAG